jgi:hypothetical protein
MSEGDYDGSVNTSVVQSLFQLLDANLSFLKGFDCHPQGLGQHRLAGPCSGS